jgi:hypothetical protein
MEEPGEGLNKRFSNLSDAPNNLQASERPEEKRQLGFRESGKSGNSQRIAMMLAHASSLFGLLSSIWFIVSADGSFE